MEARGIGLKRRTGLLAVAVVVASTMLVVPAQAANRLGKQCERDFNNEGRQIQCCKDGADFNQKELRNCKQYVRNH